MVIALIGENCSGKSTLAEKIKNALGAEIITGKDYLRMAKSEGEAEALFKKKLNSAVSCGGIVYVIADRDLLRLLPDGALIVNVGRGSTVDEDALIDGLRSGHIGGAVLDVFRQEPLPEDSPLWSMDHVILTPHMSGSGWDTDNIDRIYALFRDNFARYLTGEPLRNVVDLRRQY